MEFWKLQLYGVSTVEATELPEALDKLLAEISRKGLEFEVDVLRQRFYLQYANRQGDTGLASQLLARYTDELSRLSAEELVALAGLLVRWLRSYNAQCEADIPEDERYMLEGSEEER